MLGLVKKLRAQRGGERFRERLVRTIHKLNVQKEKLEQAGARLQQRDRELFERCVAAWVANDEVRVKMYANECAQVRTMARLLMSCQLALERVKLRLETIGEFNELMMCISPIIGVIKETKARISFLVPNVAKELEEVDSLLKGLTVRGVEQPKQVAEVEVLSDEARKILEESALIAEQRVREKFPSLPRFELPPKAMELEVEGPTGFADVPLEDRLYEYIKACKGNINLQRCALDLGTSAEVVKQTLQRLREQGRIAFG